MVILEMKKMVAIERTVFIVDDDPAARKSLALLVEPMGVATESFSSAEEFLSAIDRSRRGCLLTDVRMLGMSGVELQEKLIELGIELPVIVITAYGDVPLAVRAMKSGAVTFLEKPCRDAELWDAIRAALAQDAADSEKRSRLEDVQSRFKQLSENERQVMQLLLSGKPHKAIARTLDISLRTVESRRARVLKKMRTETLVELGQLLADMKSETTVGPRTPART